MLTSNLRVAAANINFSLPSAHLQLTSNLKVAAANMKLSLHCADLQLTTDLRVAAANMKLSLHCADLQRMSDLCWQLQTYTLPAVSLKKKPEDSFRFKEVLYSMLWVGEFMNMQLQ